MSTHEDQPGYTPNHYIDVLPRWLAALLVALFLMSTVGAVGGGWYIAHRLDVNTVDDD
jgi:hypothetical protein